MLRDCVFVACVWVVNLCGWHDIHCWRCPRCLVVFGWFVVCGFCLLF